MTHLQRTERQCWVADQYAPVGTDRECIIALWTVYRLILDLLSGCTIKQAFVTSGSRLLCLSTTPFRDNINRLWQWFKSDRPVTAAHLKKKSCTLLTQCETSLSRIIAYTWSMIGHWIEMPTDKSLRPGGCLTFFFINCTLLSRFTANFCQLQCSLSAKMWVWSFVLRGMMQPHCNTKQIMLLATEVFLVPFFKRISFYIVEFHFFNSMHPRSIFFFFLHLSTTKFLFVKHNHYCKSELWRDCSVAVKRVCFPHLIVCICTFSLILRLMRWS